jgi:hypothetical protein
MRKPEKLFPCLPGHEIIQNGCADLAQEIRNLISAPFKIYQDSYEKTLWHFAEICQSMPYAENETTYSLLERQLNICIAALKLKRGKLLPENAAPENMAKEEARYCYAIFMAGLLYGLDKIQHDRKIIFYNEKNEKREVGGQWSPLTVEATRHSVISINSRFDIQWTPCAASEILPHSTFICLIAAHIIPPKTMQWMSENRQLVPLWWNAMTGDHSEKENNSISDIIQKAVMFIDQQANTCDKNIEKPDKKETKIAELETKENKENKENNENKKNKENPEDVLKKFLDFLETRKDQDPNNILHVEAGLFITTILLQELASSLDEKSVDVILEKIKIFLLSENKQYYQKFRHKIFESRRFIEGIIIKKEYLYDSLKQLPVNQEFQPDIV